MLSRRIINPDMYVIAMENQVITLTSKMNETTVTVLTNRRNCQTHALMHNWDSVELKKNNKSYFNQDSQGNTIRRKHNKLASFNLNQMLKDNRCNYNQSLHKSTEKLNMTINWAKQRTMHLTRMEKIQMKINTKSNAKLCVIIDKESVVVKNEAVGKDSVCAKKNMPKDEGFLPQNNLFNIREGSIVCYDGLFPMYRLGATLVTYQGRVYVYGGYSFRGLTLGFHLHVYSQADKLWRSVGQGAGDLPYICPCFHTAQKYKNYLIFIGGISFNATKNQRHFNSEINLYDVDSAEWSKIKWNNCMRSHASTIYANMLVIYGGINEKDQYLSKVYFISLNSGSMGQSKVMNLSGSNRQNSGVAFHKIVNTYEIEQNIKAKIQIDGIISYGGKCPDGTVCGDVSLFKLNFRGKQNFSYSKPEVEDCNGWEILTLKGVKPEARYDHSMTMLNKKGICLIIGGINKHNQIINDAWIIDLISFSWLKAEFDSYPTHISEGLAGHTATNDGNIIYIFGGTASDLKSSNKFFSVDFSVTRSSLQSKERSQQEKGRRILFTRKLSEIPNEEYN